MVFIIGQGAVPSSSIGTGATPSFPSTYSAPSTTRSAPVSSSSPVRIHIGTDHSHHRHHHHVSSGSYSSPQCNATCFVVTVALLGIFGITIFCLALFTDVLDGVDWDEVTDSFFNDN